MNNLIIFKNNLRFNDNPVLYHGSRGSNIIPIYIYDNYNVEKDLGRIRVLRNHQSTIGSAHTATSLI